LENENGETRKIQKKEKEDGIPNYSNGQSGSREKKQSLKSK